MKQIVFGCTSLCEMMSSASSVACVSGVSHSDRISVYGPRLYWGYRCLETEVQDVAMLFVLILQSYMKTNVFHLMLIMLLLKEEFCFQSCIFPQD